MDKFKNATYRVFHGYGQAKLVHGGLIKALAQACQTQNTVWAANGVLRAKNLSAGRSLKIYNTFCNIFCKY